MSKMKVTPAPGRRSKIKRQRFGLIMNNGAQKRKGIFSDTLTKRGIKSRVHLIEKPAKLPSIKEDKNKNDEVGVVQEGTVAVAVPVASDNTSKVVLSATKSTSDIAFIQGRRVSGRVSKPSVRMRLSGLMKTIKTRVTPSSEKDEHQVKSVEEQVESKEDNNRFDGQMLDENISNATVNQESAIAESKPTVSQVAIVKSPVNQSPEAKSAVNKRTRTKSAVVDNLWVRRSLRKRNFNSETQSPPQLNAQKPKLSRIQTSSKINSIFVRQSALKLKHKSNSKPASKLNSARVTKGPPILRRQDKIDDEEGVSSCFCTKDENVAGDENSTNSSTALALARRFCQATDLIDEVITPCPRPAMTNLKLHRVSAQGVFKLLCSHHYHRLRLHHCCPICGVFCTHGKGIVMCCEGKVKVDSDDKKRDVYHLFHKSCAVDEFRNVSNGRNVQSKIKCPHCEGFKGHYELALEIRELPSRLRKPLKTLRNQSTETNEVILTKSEDEDTTVETKEEDASAVTEYKGEVIPSKEIEVYKPKILELVDQVYGNELRNAETMSKTLVFSEKEAQVPLEKLLKSALARYDLIKFVAVLRKGANPNHRYEERNGNTVLHLAIRSKSIRFVHTLINWSADPNLCDDSTISPLMAAAYLGLSDIVRYLIAVGADQHHKLPINGRTFVHALADEQAEGETLEMDAFKEMDKTVLEIKDSAGMTALTLAAKHGKEKLVEILAPLAFSFCKDILNAVDKRRRTAMHWAAEGAFCEVVVTLAKYGVSVNGQDFQGNTPLHAAIQAKTHSDRTVLMLLVVGANPYIKNSEGKSAIDMCDEETLYDEHGVRVREEIREIIAEKKKNLKSLFELNLIVGCRVGTSRINQMLEHIVCVDVSKGKESYIPIRCVDDFTSNHDNAFGSSWTDDFTYVMQPVITNLSIRPDTSYNKTHNCSCKSDDPKEAFCGGACKCHTSRKIFFQETLSKRMIRSMTIFECNQFCSCDSKVCKNRKIQQGIQSELEVFRRAESNGNSKMWGVRARNTIPMGSFVCELIGELISSDEASLRPDKSFMFEIPSESGPGGAKSVVDNGEGNSSNSIKVVIDCKKFGNIGRFLNHSSNCNLLVNRVFIEHTDLRFPRIAFIAAKEIARGEELTYSLNWSKGLPIPTFKF